VATIRKWTGRESHALREAMRLSQRDFANNLGISAKSVSNWEAGGAEFVQRPESQAILDTKLRQVSDEVRIRFELILNTAPASNQPECDTDPGSSAPNRDLQESGTEVSWPPVSQLKIVTAHPAEFPTHPVLNLSKSETRPDLIRSSFASDTSDMVEAVKRREFLLGMATTIGFGATEGVVPTFKHVDPELIPYFQRQLEGHYRADMLLGPRALISTVTAQCKLIGQLIDSADKSTRQRMAVVGTSFAAFAAWLYLDAGDIAAALHWHDVAQEMAHRSLDREAVACALVDRAMARTEQGMGVAVMDLCDSALMGAGHLSPELRVFALQQKAHGASIIGDRRQVDALLDAASRFVDQVDVEVWGVPCLRTPHYVEVHRATCYGRLGLAKEALGVWQHIIPDAPSNARRDIGVWVARQATLSASLREPEWTVELARHAVKVALETGSARVRRELAATKATMTPWQAEPVGRDFAEVLAPIGEGI
jgi:transcriptional regulator with XRE-family HTH domain